MSHPKTGAVGKIVDFYNFPDNDFRAIIQSDNGTHLYSCQITSKVAYCTCIGFSVHKHCYHFQKFLKYIKTHGVNIPMTKTLAKTSIKGLNNVIGGLPIGLPIGFYGEPRSGKSTIAVWALLDRMNETGKDGLILDAEKGLANHTIPDLVTRFNKLNKIDIGIIHKKIDFRKWLQKPSSIIPYIYVTDAQGDQNLVIVDIGNLKEMLLMVGKPHKVQTDGNKPKLTGHNFDLFPNDWDTPLARLLDDPNGEDEFCGIVLDSLTYLMKEFGVSNQSFPVRDTAQAIILNQITQIVNNLDDMIGIVILHASRPPQDSSAEVIPVGGKAIGHGFKYSVRFAVKQREDLNTQIIIVPYRLPTKIGKTSGDLITISNKGVN